MIYLDDLMQPVGEIVYCRMFSSESLKELRSFAWSLGIDDNDYRGRGVGMYRSTYCFYLVDQVKRKEALVLGAKTISCGTREWKRILRISKNLGR